MQHRSISTEHPHLEAKEFILAVEFIATEEDLIDADRIRLIAPFAIEPERLERGLPKNFRRRPRQVAFPRAERPLLPVSI